MLARSRINVGAAKGRRHPGRHRPDGAARPPWTGTFESIGFPFRTAALDPLEGNWHPAVSSFDFDEAGDRILIVGRHGLLFRCRSDGSDAETLPRPRVDNEVVTIRRTVVGVAGGFVVEGLCRAAPGPGSLRLSHPNRDRPRNRRLARRADLVVLPRPAHRRRAAGDDAIGPAWPSTWARPPTRAGRRRGRSGPPSVPIRESFRFPLTDFARRATLPTFGALGPPTCRALEARSDHGHLALSCKSRAVERSLTPLRRRPPCAQGGRRSCAQSRGAASSRSWSPGRPCRGLYFLSVPRAAVLGTFPLSERTPRRPRLPCPATASGSPGCSRTAGWKCATCRAIIRRFWSRRKRACGSISRPWASRVCSCASSISAGLGAPARRA